MKFLAILALLLVSTSARAEPRAAAPSSGTSSLLGELEFHDGSAGLSEDGGARLVAIAAWAKNHPEALIVVDGHADARGLAAGNVRLSLSRARLVRAQLLAYGMSPDQIVVAAFGPEDRRMARVTVWAMRDRYQLQRSRLL